MNEKKIYIIMLVLVLLVWGICLTTTSANEEIVTTELSNHEDAIIEEILNGAYWVDDTKIDISDVTVRYYEGSEFAYYDWIDHLPWRTYDSEGNLIQILTDPEQFVMCDTGSMKVIGVPTTYAVYEKDILENHDLSWLELRVLYY